MDLNHLFSLQYMGDDWVNIYTFVLLSSSESEVWTITHCLGLSHETMVCAVCLSIFLWGKTPTLRIGANIARTNGWHTLKLIYNQKFVEFLICRDIFDKIYDIVEMILPLNGCIAPYVGKTPTQLNIFCEEYLQPSYVWCCK